ncbi:MAG: hypothetical protein IIC13_09535 [SAR324 cluster bacterium]|nr:hypothetical protein [SAR324 cluster bacterium]MCH8886817.1 hypothetical protein [SAR324 cluster bacterium]
MQPVVLSGAKDLLSIHPNHQKNEDASLRPAWRGAGFLAYYFKLSLRLTWQFPEIGEQFFLDETGGKDSTGAGGPHSALHII